MESKLRISGIVEESIVDGPGLRFTVFTQGCPHHCRGCHNPQTHDPDGGSEMDIKEIYEAFSENPLLTGITFSGGEPFMQAEVLYYLAKKVKAAGKDIVIFSGFTLEQLLKMGEEKVFVRKLLEIADILVDGPYIEEQRNLELQYRGSENQRVIILREYL